MPDASREVYAAAKATGKRVFVIGGGEIYREALAHEECTKIHLTRVLWEGECDTFLEIPNTITRTTITKLQKSADGLRYWFEDYVR